MSQGLVLLQFRKEKAASAASDAQPPHCLKIGKGGPAKLQPNKPSCAATKQLTKLLRGSQTMKPNTGLHT
jgi:hypothetical protein